MTGRRQIAGYFSALLFFKYLGDPTGLLAVPLLFILKDRLAAGPEAVAVFDSITLIPACAGLLFGMLRDHWNPFGRRDRAYFALAAPAAIACYLWLAAAPLSYTHLLGGILGAMVAFEMLDAATSALVTVVGQRTGATGRLSALRETVETVVHFGSVLLGGWLVSRLTANSFFLLAAALTAPVFLQAFWRPRAVFPEQPPAEVGRGTQGLRELFRKLGPKGRKLWPVAAVLMLYNFAPGWYTPLFYYLTDKMHLSSEAFAACRAAQYGGVLLANVLYSRVCGRLPLRNLLWLTITINILPGFLYLLIDGAAAAIVISAIVGFVSGFATVAVFDLLMRSCPSGMEGSFSALGHSCFVGAGAFADILGATVYARAGFAPCLIMDALATAAILPLLRQVPAEILSSSDGELVPVAVSA